MNTSSTTSFAVLSNGGPSEFFRASRGLGQGDPLSPMLFILIMKTLNGLMNKAKELQLFKGVGVLRSNLTIEVSHLLFADDTLIFCHPDVRNLLHLRCILFCFQGVSILKINLQKLELVKVGGDGDGRQYVAVMERKEVLLMVKYLGLPLGAKY